MASAARAAKRHPAPRPCKDVMIGSVRSDFVAGMFADCLFNLKMYDEAKDNRIRYRATLVSGPRIAPARNMIMEQFLESDCTWLWWLDTDMTFANNTLDRLIAAAVGHHAQIVGALCFSGGRAFDIEPVLYEPDDERGMKRARQYPADTMTRVSSTGAACLLVHRDVVQDVKKLYEDRAHIWFEETTVDLAEFGEDVTFCMRAANAGYQTWVHTGIQVGHLKLMPLHEGEYARRFALTDEQKAEESSAWYRAMGIQ